MAAIFLCLNVLIASGRCSSYFVSDRRFFKCNSVIFRYILHKNETLIEMNNKTFPPRQFHRKWTLHVKLPWSECPRTPLMITFVQLMIWRWQQAIIIINIDRAVEDINWITAWWHHQMETSSAILAFCVGNSPVTGELSPVNSPHKGQWRGALMFSSICTWANSWENNGNAGDLRCHLAHYDVIVTESAFSRGLWVDCKYHWENFNDWDKWGAW